MSDATDDEIEGEGEPCGVVHDELAPPEVLMLRELLPFRDPPDIPEATDRRIRRAVDMATIAINEAIARICRLSFPEDTDDAGTGE